MNINLLHTNSEICLQTNNGADEVIYDAKVIKYSCKDSTAEIDIKLDNNEIIHISNNLSSIKNSMYICSTNSRTFWVYRNRESCYKFLLGKHESYAKNTEWKAQKRHEMLAEHYRFLLENINNPYI